jgi:Immunity protein 53
MNPISELTWLQAWYLLWCDNDWEHSYGVVIESQSTVGWVLKADLSDTPLEGRPLKPNEHRRTVSDWVTWEVDGSVFRSLRGLWNLTEMIGISRGWVQGLDAEPRAVSAASRFLIESGHPVPKNLLELPWLENWHRDRVLRHEQAYVKIETLDNPGWAFEVQLSPEVARVVESSVVLRPERTRGWLDWKIEKNRVISHAGPDNLIDQVEELRSRLA